MNVLKPMKKVLLTLALVFGLCSTSYAQLDAYKYIIVPKKFDAFKEPNQYQTSTLIKYLFTKQGFTTAYEDQLPFDLQGNRCLGLLVDLMEESSMFTTKTSILLKDCRGEEVFVTAEGRSKEKEYKAAYSEAIRKAFQSFEGIAYSYTPKEATKSEPVTVSFKDDVKNMETEAVAEPVAEKADEMISQTATPEVQSYEDKTPQPKEGVAEKAVNIAADTSEKMEAAAGHWYAQEIQNGFQLVDSTPKIRLKIYTTSVPDVYLASNEKGNGLVYQKSGVWFFERYEDGKLKTDVLNIKF